MNATAQRLQVQLLKEIVWQSGMDCPSVLPGVRNVATSVAATPTAGAFRGNCRKAFQEKVYG
jgi:hypothetical protein